MEELKPCPFCGAKVTPIETRAGYGELYCGNCDVVMGGNEPKTPEELTEAWNTRHERTCEVCEVCSGTGWIEFQCSICGCNRIDKHDSYCPSCGAKVVSE